MGTHINKRYLAAVAGAGVADLQGQAGKGTLWAVPAGAAAIDARKA